MFADACILSEESLNHFILSELKQSKTLVIKTRSFCFLFFSVQVFFSHLIASRSLPEFTNLCQGLSTYFFTFFLRDRNRELAPGSYWVRSSRQLDLRLSSASPGEARRRGPRGVAGSELARGARFPAGRAPSWSNLRSRRSSHWGDAEAGDSRQGQCQGTRRKPQHVPCLRGGPEDGPGVGYQRQPRPTSATPSFLGASQHLPTPPTATARSARLGEGT